MDALTDVLVVPDRGGQGQEALDDACADPCWRASAVVFKVELGLEGVIDGFDDLP